jgi:hypothetical protein
LVKEENHASIASRGVAAQPSKPPAKKIALNRMWESLPEERRRRALITLRRIITQQIPLPRSEEEVAHEDR